MISEARSVCKCFSVKLKDCFCLWQTDLIESQSQEYKIKYCQNKFYASFCFVLQQFPKQKQMGLLSKVRDAVKFTDLFYSAQLLRLEDEQEYRTLTGGILSICIIITTLIGFASMILDTLALSSITTTFETVKNQIPTYSSFSTTPENNFMFAIQVWMVDTTGPQRYFDVQLAWEVMKDNAWGDQTFVNLEPCTKEHWASYPTLVEKFQKLRVNSWLCPPIGHNFQLFGKFSSDQYSAYSLAVSACKNQTDPSRPCYPQADIDQLFSDFQSQFYFTLYFLNPTINTDRKEYKSYYINDQNYLMFGDKLGVQAYVYFTDYTIETDQSIWPFKDVVHDHGLMVGDPVVNHPHQTVEGGTYAKFIIAKSSNSITYTREVQKISSVFSFIGGMISAVSAVLFFVRMYTSFAFEISIALSIFDPQKDSSFSDKKIRMSFLTFVKYNIYQLCEKVGIELDWPVIKFIKSCQQEIVKHLDVRSLVNRIIFLEHCLSYVFEDYQLDAIQMKTPTSPHQVKLIRQKCQCVLEGQQLLLASQVSEGFGFDDTVHKYQMKQSPSPLNRENTQKKGPDLIVEDVMSDNLSDVSPKGSKTSIRSRTFKKRVTNRIANDFGKGKIRDMNLHMLYLNAEKGNEMSKKIWESLEMEIRDKVMLMEKSSSRLNSVRLRGFGHQ